MNPCITAFLFVLIPAAVSAQPSYETQRDHMVKIQLMGRDIRDKATLQAMEDVPRHEFVPAKLRSQAYVDGPLPIGNEQTISQPYIVAYMTQALKPRSHFKVLEIGTGSGYQAAVLAEIVDSVYTMEIVPDLGKRAEGKLRALGYSNVEVRIGDGYHGWPARAPFDAIMVTAGAEEIPQPLLAQLKEGGKLIIPLGPHHGVRQLLLIEKKGDRFLQKELIPVRFVPFTRDHP